MIKDLFKEYLTLGYTPGESRKTFRDVDLGNYIIARETRRGYVIHYLFNGTRIEIDWEWVEVFEEFNVWRDNRDLVAEDGLETFILSFSRLVDSLFTSKPDSDTLEILGDICQLGTKRFKKWLEEEEFFELKEKLKPIKYISLEKSFEL